jgi:hypothetical protein
MAEMRQGRNDERHWKDKKDEDGKKEEDGECDQRPEGAEEEELEEVDCSAGEGELILYHTIAMIFKFRVKRRTK